ncbi:hypothetical protein DJ013_12155 [Arcticibacterium luteifluviistationis]|uniref:WxL domain-containing protein n=2 Tax=Arcticibacterium luteifluviistationis TaxID=1784714 RepID=A0A2Z4GCL9_9BACT|nr:hypothetical protein DJ013_12155 [Arcticibacterium luteifluviistationis]
MSVTSMAQDTQTDNHVITVKVPNVALLDLESTASKNFNAEFTQATPLEAGEKITKAQDNSDTWLNYSSILVDGGASSRHVDVKIDELVPGITIKVKAGNASTGEGTLGSTGGRVTLSTVDQVAVAGIGSAYTETGASKGHRLTYSFNAPNSSYADLRAKDYAVTVTYTLADD